MTSKCIQNKVCEVNGMNYQKLYTCLFNGITDAIEQLDRQNYGLVRALLIDAQLRAEELYLEAENENNAETE